MVVGEGEDHSYDDDLRILEAMEHQHDPPFRDVQDDAMMVDPYEEQGALIPMSLQVPEGGQGVVQ